MFVAYTKTALGRGGSLLAALVLSAGVSVIAPDDVSAQSTGSEIAREVNRGRIGLLTGASTSTNLSVGADIERILDGKSDLRIVPYLSYGSIDNIDDLMSFRFADMALINSDALLSRKLRNPDDDRLNRINYIARLFTNEVHVIVRADSGLNTIGDLSGLRFAAGEAKSGSFLTASLLMRASGIRATAIAMPPDEGLLALQDGDVDAVFLLEAKPSSFLRRVESEEELALLSVPLSENLRGVYKSSEFTSDEYPGLVRDKFVETVSVDVILAAYGNAPSGSDEYRKIVSFVSELERNRAQLLRPPSHAKWQQFSFEAEVADMPRNNAAAAVLAGEDTSAPEQPNIFDLMRQGVDE